MLTVSSTDSAEHNRPVCEGSMVRKVMSLSTSSHVTALSELIVSIDISNQFTI